ncbi:transposase [Ligilactobacillus salivarius]|nr:transposase [Ligilactobacillus salivarius]
MRLSSNSLKIIIKILASVLFDKEPQALKTIKKHKVEIENSFVLPKLTNGPIEGVNNHIKVIKRIAYGYNNFKHFRLRILISLKNNVIFFST